MLGHAVRVARALLAVILALGLAAPHARADFGADEKKFDDEAYPAELRSRVSEAIVRAANWLLLRQKDDGSWSSPFDATYPMGATAFATLALLKAGIPAGHPRIERAFAFLRKQKLRKTYEVGILLMALDAKYGVAKDPFEKDEVDRYGNRVVAEPCAEHASKDDLAWMKQGVDFLVANQTGGHWRYPEGGFDLSNTQYALLGLKAADRCGLKVPLEVWRSSLTFLLGYQDADGAEVALRGNEVRGRYRIEWSEKAKARGFRYVAKAPVTGAMTTAGAAGLMICQGMLWKSRKFDGDARARTRAAVRDALAWMQVNFDVTTNPGGGEGAHFYYLYGLERMAISGHVRFLGTYDWYADGAEVLLHEQEDLGCWGGEQVVETCYALLFLKRSSFRIANPSVTPGAFDLKPSDPGKEKAPDAPGTSSPPSK
jgi:hypothetical protein